MSVKNGFGGYSEIVNSVVVLGVPQDSGNRNLIVQLPSKNEKRIFDLVVGYSLVEGFSYSSILRGGRLLIVGSKYSGVTEYINPAKAALPDSLGNARVYFDMPISPDVATALAIEKRFQWLDGLRIPDGTAASIILTYSINVTSAITAQEDTNAYINVNGTMSGSDKIFKNV